MSGIGSGTSTRQVIVRCVADFCDWLDVNPTAAVCSYIGNALTYLIDNDEAALNKVPTAIGNDQAGVMITSYVVDWSERCLDDVKNIKWRIHNIQAYIGM